MNYPASLNPFLDNDDDTPSFFSPEMPPSYPPPPPPHHHQYSMSHLKLPVFWADAPMAWFVAVEAQFQLRWVWSEDQRFCNIIASLDKMILKKVVHLVVTPDIRQPYTKLKEALLTSHQLRDLQRVELILTMEPMGSQKLLELLTDMWEVCSADKHNSKFFATLFLQRLPSHIRVLLTHDYHADLQLLAAKVDCLVANLGGHTSTVVAAMEDLITTLLAKARQQRGGKQNKKQPPLPLRPQSNSKEK